MVLSLLSGSCLSGFWNSEISFTGVCVLFLFPPLRYDDIFNARGNLGKSDFFPYDFISVLFKIF